MERPRSLSARLSSLVSRLYAALRPGRRSPSDFAAELQAHLELEAGRLREAGMSEEEALAAARRNLGNMTHIQERFYESRRWLWLDRLVQDVHYGLRQMRRNPGFTSVAILTLALGIGANAAIFTLTYAVILKGLPVPNPGALVRYTFRNGAQDLGLSGPAYDALRRHETVDTGILAWGGATFTVKENGLAERIDGAMMTGNGFRILELHPYLGRAFGERDDVPGSGPNGYQALLGYGYWKSHFNESRAVLGKSLTVDGRVVTIIGILPPRFDGLVAGGRTDLLLPLSFEQIANAPTPLRHSAGAFWLTVLGRLKPGKSIKAAKANLNATLAEVRKEADPTGLFLNGFFRPFHFGVESGRAGRSMLRVEYEEPLLALEILVGFLLMLCCANTALLFLAHVGSREREFAVRSALGAPRARLLSQVLSEVALLATSSGGLGILFGWAGARGLVSMFAAVGQAPPLDLIPRTPILAFTAGAGVLSAWVAGLWPAWRASRVAPILGVKQTAGASPKRMGGWIVPVQVAVSVILLVSASLLGSTFLRLLLQKSGFRTNGVVIADVNSGSNKITNAQATADAIRMVDALENAPGVHAATAMSYPPIHDWWSAGHYFSIGPHGAVHTDLQTWPETVSSAYFTVMGTRILEGRTFDRADSHGARVCILSVSAARYFFPRQDPIDRFVYAAGSNPRLDGKRKVDAEDAYRVIGVAQDARFRSLDEPPPRMLYFPILPKSLGNEFFLAVLGHKTPLAAEALRNVVRAVVPTAAQPEVYTFNALVNQNLRTERMLMALSTCFAAIALLLTALGLYGLMSRSVAARTQEIGVRVALGAPRGHVLTLVIRQGLLLVLGGAAVGLGAALVVARLLRSLLFGVHSGDPKLLAASMAVIFAVALLACFIPARRATKVDPMVALRYE